ncbi:ankyrin [Neocallimastix californiae]|uniref:Ankyrin n=1 Tax=Neocallimastix californiae TaxID=1754190 RepID=A0A1Y2EH25_9FUNG|nr:ankyrin [Neocallimastix californiae]|eukprot:ORY70870.1 ankyrin [Neocallimastix californiae]
MNNNKTIENFETSFLDCLNKNNEKCIEIIEKNKSFIIDTYHNKDLLKSFVDKINNIIIQSNLNFTFFEKVLKQSELKDVYDEFKSSDILIKVCKNEEETNVKLINWLLSMNINVDLTDETDRTSCMYLALNGKIKELELLIRNGANLMMLNIINILNQFNCNFNVIVDEDENTAFMALLLLNSLFLPSEIINIVKKNKNFDFCIKNKFQENATSLLIKLNNQVLLLNLINNLNFDYNYKDFENGNNLIMLCAISQANILDQLLNMKIMKNKINELNNNNENALIIATKAGCVDCVKLLLKYHINVNQQDNLGNTALHYAITIGDKYLINLICSKKANYNLKNKEGFTPSMYAVRTGDKEITSIMSKPKKDIIRSTFNISKVAYNKYKNHFNYIIPKTTKSYNKFDLELVFKNANQIYYPANLDKIGLLKEIAIGLSTL